MNGGLKQTIKQQFAANKRQHGKRSYTVPTPDTYPYQWLWDSCFNAITMSYFDIPRAKEELELLVSAQFKNGMLPQIVYWNETGKAELPGTRLGNRYTSSLTQPPLLAAAVWRLYEADQDMDFAEKMLISLHANHRYLLTQRDPDGIGLAAIVDPDESGEDNSPRFDKVSNLKTPRRQFVEEFRTKLEHDEDRRGNRFVVKDRLDEGDWVYDLSFNCILVESLRLTAMLAKATGIERIARYSDAKAHLVGQAINANMKRRGRYYSLQGKRLKPLLKDTWAEFMPLYAGLVDETEAANLIKDRLNSRKHYAATFRLPTVPLNSKSFDPRGDWRGEWWVGTNWRGPIWIGAKWFVFQGLLKYGYRRDAKRIFDDSTKLIEQSGMREYYDPLTGQGHGAKGFSWNGLVLDMDELINAKH